MTLLNRWQRLGRLLAPTERIPWLRNWTGASAVLPIPRAHGEFELFVTGRDDLNRSEIGVVRIGIDAGEIRIIDHRDEPVLRRGALGTFDENGVSYPWPVVDRNRVLLYYTGWMPTLLTPFQNHLGLAVRRSDGGFERLSHAPVLHRSDSDPFSIGSVCVLQENARWRMYYTSFTAWEEGADGPRHRYLIKYAESADGIDWRREDIEAIGFNDKSEFAICRPSVLFADGRYHMWYCYRGLRYRIGYATSADGVKWVRQDDEFRFEGDPGSWELREQCYPFVFRHEERLYMAYCGDEYGRAGMGMARLIQASVGS